jgi:DNA sulfur modification protein DndD
MLIKELRLLNFRQFAGETSPLQISSSQAANVTLFHGEMGHGKTTILNAFRWVLHGRNGVSDRFTGSHSIINRYVVESDSTAVSSVSLVFMQHVQNEGDMHVSIKRTVTSRQESALDSLAANYGELEVVTINTTHPNLTTPKYVGADAQNYINSIIPEGILDILFFDGEGIDKLMEENQSEDMAAAVRNILGFSVLERAIEDLGHEEVLGYFENERNESADDQLLLKYNDEKTLVTKLALAEQNLKESKERRLFLEKESEETQLKLGNCREVADLTKDQEGLMRKMARDEKSQAKALQELKNFMRKNAFKIVSRRMLSEGAKLERKFRDDGEFPAPITSAYVHELLEKGICLCGRPLAPNTPEHQHVHAGLSFARDAQFHEAASSVGKVLDDLSSNNAGLRAELEALRDKYILIDDEIRNDDASLKNIQAQILKLGNVDVKSLEARLLDLGGDIKLCRAEITRIEDEVLPDLKGQLERLRTEIASLALRSEQSALMDIRVELIKQAISRLHELLRIRAEHVGTKLNEIVNRNFQSLTDIEGMARVVRKPRLIGQADAFIPEILIKNLNGDWIPETGVNTGRRQCLSLAFISALVELASNKANFNDQLDAYFPSNDYPVVMDAPFGVLDSVSSGKLAKSLPSFASQVVCLINYSSYKNIKDALDAPGVIGKRYVLFHAYDPNELRNPRTEDILGQPVLVAGPAEAGSFVHSEVRPLNS